ncbi:MAG: DUF1549 domain-containing protein [Planctomycetaceae bacterium]|jgi:hypothetical protein|nr:DUF1549 domain-containing protein [Planctomycetaceae bacterium]MBT6158152.1 DUF1549 domain-containing protein [Planctomycetaceae bacterium]MBT6484444.1 DUF1549 domain-containing protein [Planctomycetaceae bacterium]MBT6494911.1 DUF1549 domain-containing protein [Planctomycetaceae bacterium]
MRIRRSATVARMTLILALACLFAVTGVHSAGAADSDSDIVAKINEYVRQGWADNEVEPSVSADDYEFARRAALDIIGHVPSYDMLMEFLEDESPDKRQKYIDRLLDDPDYVKNWTNVWANILVGRAGNRGNRGTLERWLRGSFYRNEAYNKFVHELIAAEGTSRENGAVAFLASHLNDGALPATSISARVFLGMQVQCTQCHNHPFNDWKQNQFWSMNGFFRGTKRMRGLERGQTGLTDEPTTEVIFYEQRSGLMKAAQRKYVDGTRVAINDTEKPRTQLANLITDPEKPFLAAAQVNRLWGHFFGFAFTRPVDDMGPHNPPSHPELLDFISSQFRQAGFDNKRLIRWIAASEAYQLTSRYGEKNSADSPSSGNVPLFSRMYLKNFTAEQLYDSLIVATEAHKANRNSEAAENQRQQWLRQFVQTFGTDENDEATTFNGTIPQALVMMNGALIGNAISGDRGAFLKRVLEAPNGDIRAKKKTVTRRKPLTRREQLRLTKAYAKSTPAKIETLFLVALQRKPSETEVEGFNSIYQESGSTDPVAGLQDVFWAILNSNEFIINH